ncbi:unnamed protein product [Spirodela intermedia]|uniref:Uncharacterized protein n=1 Tax=Spirodela intermedia TaxID=51605 RepID=A0A7I8IQT0_SPIIN|nr:unnamed protein product [Spirodela intermedia]CAA6659361.1 unnamed protein product [Spirodela intermedia]
MAALERSSTLRRRSPPPSSFNARRRRPLNQIPRTPALRAHSAGRGYRPQLQQVNYGDGDQEAFWLALLKDVIWSFRFLVSFLAEQPGQLKYIEWPSFQTTVSEDAALTLVLVAVLIVALSSVDSGLCYLLALMLRSSV